MIDKQSNTSLENFAKEAQDAVRFALRMMSVMPKTEKLSLVKYFI